MELNSNNDDVSNDDYMSMDGDNWKDGIKQKTMYKNLKKLVLH